MWSQSFDLISPLARDECVLRLRAKTESGQSFEGDVSNKPVAGHIADASFRICKRTAFRNAFQPHLSGELRDEDGRTRVCCRLGTDPVVVRFMRFWFRFVLTVAGPFTAIGIGLLLSGEASPDARILLAFLPAFMLAAGVAMVGLGRHLSRGEPRFLVDFLRDTIAAGEV